MIHHLSCTLVRYEETVVAFTALLAMPEAAARNDDCWYARKLTPELQGGFSRR
ncbi:hypothetical protein GOSPT_014_00050 [Gordonia sputi NBRC 100414]|uniref:Uncharacterized protein n=1 Tax=Gordonia sputi NBRC 100414 TaxID=1089453 RepID=H5TVN4_9ACTN|nr:hypothetical protein GOSPT_014_00050 [Gordonia sputi NBRC 100414]